jgi:hypothetical protein
MADPLQFGHNAWLGNVVAPQSAHWLPMSCGLSSGQVEMSGASILGMVILLPRAALPT